MADVDVHARGNRTSRRQHAFPVGVWLVVEGKLGWSKFLACYLGIGLSQAVLEQLVMLGYSGDVPGSLGASSAIFGLMAMAAVWAPKNEITFFYCSSSARARSTSASWSWPCCTPAWMLMFVMLFGGGAATSLLHLTGAARLAAGNHSVEAELVDCEGWDLFHVWRGDYGAFKTEPKGPRSSPRSTTTTRRDRDELVDGQAQLASICSRETPRPR